MQYFLPNLVYNINIDCNLNFMIDASPQFIYDFEPSPEPEPEPEPETEK